MRLCHVCHSTIAAERTFCTSCGHPLCKTCNCPVPEGAEEAHRVFVASGGAHLTVRDGETLTSYNRSVPPSPTREAADPLDDDGARLSRQHSTTQDTERDETTRRTAPATTFFSRPLAPRKSKISTQRGSRVSQVTAEPPEGEHPGAGRFLRQSKASRSKTAPSDCVTHRSDSEYGEEPCSDPVCRATHPGYRPYRHSLACTKRRIAPSGAEHWTDSDASCSDHSSPILPSSYHHNRHPVRIERYKPADGVDYAHRSSTRPRYHGEGPYHCDYDRSSGLPSGHPTVDYDHHRSRGSPHRHRNSHRHGLYPDVYRERSGRGEPFRHHNAYHQPYDTHDYVYQPRGHQRSATHERYHYHPHTHSPPPQAARESEDALGSQSPAEDQTHQGILQPEQESTPTRERLNSLQTKSAPSLQTASIQSPTDDKAKDFREVRLKLRPTSATPRQSKTATELQDQNEEDFREMRKNLHHYSPPLDERGSGSRNDKSQRTSTSTSYPQQAQTTSEPQNSTVPVETGSPRAGPSSVDKGKRREKSRGRSRESIRQSTSKITLEHDCDWKQKYDELQYKLESQNKSNDIGLEGLTIVLHMKDRDDLVINTDLRKIE